MNVFGLWAYDAAWALATAVETTNFPSRSTNISAGAASLERLEVTQSGPELVRKLSGTRFTGLSGDFSLINGQLQSSTFQVVNVNDNGERGVGYWTPKNGLVRNLKSKNASRYATSTASLGTIIWPGDITSAPKGWQIPMSGIKLKILVPVKNGFKEFVNVTYDNSTNTINVTGYCIDVFKAVIDHESLQYTVPYEFYAYANFSYRQLIDQVFLGNYDAAVGDITIRANRSLYVDFTLPYTESGISMIVPIKDNNGAKNTWVFLKPLTLDLWVTIGCFFVFTGFVVWVLEHRINKDFRGPPRHQIGTSFWFSFSTMAFAHRERVVTNLARFVIIIWCFVVLILTQSYTASFSSILTVRQLQPIITDVNLLMKNGDNVGYKSAFIYEMLKERGFQEEKLRKYSTQEELDELLRNGNGNHGISAAFDETPYMKVFLATYCSKYTMVEPTFSTDGFAFIFRKGSSLTRDVSTAITRLHEGAEMQKIEDKWFKKKASCSNPSTTTTSSNSLTLSLDSFWGLFIVAGVASSVALLISAAMFFHEHRHILTSFDPETSFWCRIRVVLRLYDQRDPNWDDYNGTRLQDSVHGKIGAVEPSPNTDDVHSPPRPSSTESHIVIEELGTPADTELCDLNLNGQATQETEYICN